MRKFHGKKVFVGMSGGVDSSVAAALLKERGFDVIGVHLKCFNVDGCAAQDAEDARRAAEHLGIPFYTFDYEKEYKDRVVEYMIDGYKKGITPNPDVMCNKEIKFGLFYKKAMEMGADYVATGHYVRRQVIKLKVPKVRKVRTKKDDQLYKPYERYKLLTARDSAKDQSYFLWTLKSEQLKHCLFPIGDYKKPQVRKLAAKFGLHNALKKDSQGICFLGQVSLPDFLKKYIKPKKGDVILSDSEGSQKIVGQHNGAHFYTIGQRHIGLANRRLTRTERGTTQTGDIKPFYVAAKDIKKNIVVVAEGEDNPALYKKEIELANVNLVSQLTKNQLTVYARVRYRQPLQKAKLVFPRQPASKSASVRVVFSRPIKFVAPGQSAVFYDKKGVMLGGGIIKSAV